MNTVLQEALDAASQSLPQSRCNGRIYCKLCGQIVEEGGDLGGVGAPGGMDGEMDGMGDEYASLPSPLNRKTPRAIAAILAALREYPLIGRAARAGGISPRTFQEWRRDDPELRAATEEARDEGIERIELRAHEDAVHGNDREGTLMRMFTLKRHRPEYRDNVTVRHEGGGQDARDAALLRRAMVEALGPYPEARAALAATLARLGGVETGAPALPTGDRVRVDRLADGDVVDAEVVEVEAPAEGESSQAGRATHTEEREAPGAATSAATSAGGGVGVPGAELGTMLSASPSSPSNKGVGSSPIDKAIPIPHFEGDDEGSDGTR